MESNYMMQWWKMLEMSKCYYSNDVYDNSDFDSNDFDLMRYLFNNNNFQHIITINITLL